MSSDLKKTTDSFQAAANSTQPPGPVGLMSRSQKAAQRPRGPIDIAFVFDATGSRESTWKKAQKIQSEMIQEYASGADNVHVGIIVHRGRRVENLGWFNQAGPARDVMARVSCKVGGTNIEGGLESTLEGRGHNSPKAVVIVGDCCEEDRQDILNIANRLKDENVPVHAFHEGSDRNGEQIYKMIADATGGAFAKFGRNMSLQALTKPLFVHAVQGPAAFQRLLNSGDEGAKALAQGGLLKLGPKGP